eukprot:ANDGO_04212.mRNA.1 hypothetical protein Pmar_PMAR016868
MSDRPDAGALTAMLRSAGKIGSDVSVVDAVWGPIVGGATSQVFRVGLRYSSEAPGNSPPSTIVVKLGAVNTPLASFVETVFQPLLRESLFYSSSVPSLLPAFHRAPECLYCTNPESLQKVQSDAEKSFCLVMEDISGEKWIKCSQEAGASYDEARLVITALARFHASFWAKSSVEKDELVKKHFQGWQAPEECAKAAQNVYASKLSGLLDIIRSAPGCTKEAADKCCHLLSNFGARYVEYQKSADALLPATLLHGDSRFSNFFLASDDSGVVVCDWQGFSVGNCGANVAYFLAESVKTEVRQQHEQELMELYVRELHATNAATQDFSFADFRKDYMVGLLVISFFPVLCAGYYNHSQEVKAMIDRYVNTLGLHIDEVSAAVDRILS